MREKQVPHCSVLVVVVGRASKFASANVTLSATAWTTTQYSSSVRVNRLVVVGGGHLVQETQSAKL